jgi:hypothetical protein
MNEAAAAGEIPAATIAKPYHDLELRHAAE